MADLKPASKLRLERVRAGWRIPDLAKEADMAENTLYRIEVGLTKMPTPDHRRRLAAVLKVKEAVLFGKVGK